MSINSRFAVAVHVLTLLAQPGDEPITSEEIAGSVNTHPVVIRRSLGKLREARLVTIQPGVNGGARLARPANQISLLEVYQAVEEGELFALHNQPPNPNCQIGANIETVLEDTFEQAQQAMFQTLAGVTVGQILQQVLSQAKAAS